MKIAIVHERLTEIAGSEHVVTELAREWPDAPVSIPIADSRVTTCFSSRVNTSAALSTAYRASGYRSYAPLLPLVPAWLRHRDFGAAEAVVISHHAFALAAVNAASPIPTIAYVHSPARWAWDEKMRAEEASSWPGRKALDLLSGLAIKTELAAAQIITSIVANSTSVAARIKRHWQRDAQVVHPPVNIDFYTPDDSEARGEFFLLAGRMVSYKRPDVAIRAAVESGVKLVVAGDGRDAAKCRKLSTGGDVEFLGRVSDEELRSLYRRAKAMVMPGEQDFGITPVEAMACGTPVIALGVGGALDSVVEGTTGTLIQVADDAAVVTGFAEKFASFDSRNFDRLTIRAHAEQFSRENFRRNMARIVTQAASTSNAERTPI